VRIPQIWIPRSRFNGVSLWSPLQAVISYGHMDANAVHDLIISVQTIYVIVMPNPVVVNDFTLNENVFRVFITI